MSNRFFPAKSTAIKRVPGANCTENAIDLGRARSAAENAAPSSPQVTNESKQAVAVQSSVGGDTGSETLLACTPKSNARM
eukprot:803991-Rhodomonas_salina.1